MKAKKVILTIIDVYIMWFVATAGPCLTVYGILFQTECFYYVSWLKCLIMFAACAIVAFLIVRFAYTETKSGNPARSMPATEPMKPIMRVFLIAFFLSLAVTYTARMISVFMVGVGGMSLSSFMLLFYMLWRVREEKRFKEEEKARAAEKSGAV